MSPPKVTWKPALEFQKVVDALDSLTKELKQLHDLLKRLEAAGLKRDTDQGEYDLIDTEIDQQYTKLNNVPTLTKQIAADFAKAIRIISRQLSDTISEWTDRIHFQQYPPPVPPNVAQRFGPGGIIGGIGGNGIGGGSIGGTGHGFGGGGTGLGFGGGGGGGPNSTDHHGIPGIGFGKRPGDDEGSLGMPGVHGSGFQGNYGNGFFGSGFLHPGVGLGGGLTGGGSGPSGGGLTAKRKTGSGTTGGSYVDSASRNDARGSGSDRDRGGGNGVDKATGGGGGVDKGAENAAGRDSPAERAEKELAHEIEHYYEQHKDDETAGPGDQSGPVDGGGGDTGGGATESRPTFTGYHPQHGGPAGAVTVGVGQHLPGSPTSYITATSHVGSIGGTTEGFGGTNPNVRVYRPDPEASGGGSGPRNPYFMPSEETGSPRGPSARIARQVTVTSTGVRTRLR